MFMERVNIVIHSRREYPYNEHIDMCIKEVLSIVELIKLIIMLPKFKLYIFISHKIDEKIYIVRSVEYF